MENLKTIKKTVLVGKTKEGFKTYLTLELTNRNNYLEFTCSGVEGPLRSGNSKGSCGQITIDLDTFTSILPVGDLLKIIEYWDKYHLNGLNSGTERQNKQLIKKFGKKPEYTEARQYLDKRYIRILQRLYEEKPYKDYHYGSSRIYKEIPVDEIYDFIDRLPQAEDYPRRS